AHETDLTATVDPFAGSYAVESMTDDVAEAAAALMAKVEELGGAVAAIEQGFQKEEIERSAYRVARQIDNGERVVVGVNRFVTPDDERYEPLRVDPAIEEQQAERLRRLRSARGQAEVQRRLTELRKTAAGRDNVLEPLREALRVRATVGEVCDALREVWGVYQPPDAA
ncbi:MAG: methylmalonyl-CoA mutase, partial [Actinobacteria bacterium]|nr:methylmalonyl-CoA mutase [Actinomycetota bacterium]